MLAHLRANALLLLSTVAIGSVAYPAVLLGVAQLVPTTASGSLVFGPDGQPVGSRLIAQEFKGDEWFHPRPSAVGYNAGGSGGSNLGANNPKLRERLVEDLKAYPDVAALPADAVTASGSGLDPHLTLRSAQAQLDRVAAAVAAKSGRDVAATSVALDGLLRANAFTPMAGLVGGEPLVNVLEVNRAIGSLNVAK